MNPQKGTTYTGLWVMALNPKPLNPKYEPTKRNYLGAYGYCAARAFGRSRAASWHSSGSRLLSYLKGHGTQHLGLLLGY